MHKHSVILIAISPRPYLIHTTCWFFKDLAPRNLELKSSICNKLAFILSENYLGAVEVTDKQGTGKSFSEVLILASTNPQYDKRLSIELPVQYMKIPNSEHCQKQKQRTICVQNMF